MYISIPSINHVVVAGSGKEKGGIHSKNEIEKWLNEGFKGNTLIFILFLYDGIQWNLGKKLPYSRVLGVWKLENQWWYSLKLGDFGDVKGLRPLTSPKPPVSMKPPLVSNYPQKTWNPNFLPKFHWNRHKKKKSGFPLKILTNIVYPDHGCLHN